MTTPVTEAEAPQAPKYYGKYAGVVLNNDPPENADHRGEVLVEVSGLLEENPSGSGQRPMQVLAKPCLPPGLFFVPAPQSHVWVEFAAGELDDPLWSGVWYPDGTPPQTPDGNAPTKFQKVVRIGDGHVVMLDDSSSGWSVVVLARKNRITLDDAGMILKDKNENTITMSSSGIVIEDKNKNKLTMSSNGVELAGKDGRKVVLDSSSVKLE